MKMQVMTVTPEMAADWLKMNTGNRRLRRWWVKTLADVIRRGEWSLTHQGVAFDTNGILRDGQHRLSAIVEAGRSAELVVFTGLSEEAYKAMDQGAKRTASDISGLDRRIMEPCALAARIAFGNQTSFAQIERILESRICELSIDLTEAAPGTRRLFSSAPIKLGAILCADRGAANKQFAIDTYRSLINLDFSEMTPTAQALVRQAQHGKIRAMGSDSLNDLLARAFVVFDPVRSQVSRLIVSSNSDAVAEARAAILRIIGQAA